MATKDCPQNTMRGSNGNANEIKNKNKKKRRRRNKKHKHNDNKNMNNFPNKLNNDAFDEEQENKKFKAKENNPIGYFMNIGIAKIDSYLDQMPNMTNKCLMYASGFCRFGGKCPNIEISQSAHNAKLLLKKENDWINCKGLNQCNYRVLNNNNNNKKWYKSQLYNFLAVLDLEGLPEIVEFPVILINLNEMGEVGRFHHYVIPQQFIKDKIFENISKEEYEEKNKNDDINDYYNKYSNGLPFADVMRNFDKWLNNHHVFDNYNNGKKSILFAICGNWDIAKQIPLQCYRCGIAEEFPKYMYEWMNIKDFGLNFYKNAKPNDMLGMASTLKFLKIPLLGTHHSGMDDTSNIAKIIVRFIKDGAIICDTARRNPKNINEIQFRYQNNKRIGWGGIKIQRF